MNEKISFTYRELRYLLTLLKDRLFKVSLGDLKYSQYFLEIEKNIASTLKHKLEKAQKGEFK